MTNIIGICEGTEFVLGFAFLRADVGEYRKRRVLSAGPDGEVHAGF